MNFNQTTPTTISIQARDCMQFAFLMGNDSFYSDILFDLMTLFKVATPPTGAALVNIPAQPLGVYLKIFYDANNKGGKQIFKAATNRLRTTLEALATTEITTFFSDFNNDQTTIENTYQEVGRKILRGKLG